ncbi:unnamed protein product [Acanthosepion pharaonis]|uniref:Uncharacterized protein n=1 Tax=Acanthosepion pharaonis TaxID=158019 RepID=A0A812BK00_ACAPH|nr:unnamed protein product [Sepia pharaonis]
MLLLYLFWAGPGRFPPLLGQLALAEMLLLYLFWAGPGRFPPAAGRLALAEMLLYLFWAGPGRFLPAVWTARLGGKAVLVSVRGWAGRFLPAAWIARLGGNAVVVSFLRWARPDSYPCLDSPWRKCCCCICLGLGRPIPTAADTARLAEMLFLGQADFHLFWDSSGLGGPGPNRFYRCLDSSPWRKCCCCIRSGLGRADSYRCLDSSPWRKCCCCICSGLGRADFYPLADSSPWRKCSCCICSGWAGPIPTRCGQLALAEMLLFISVLGRARPIPTAAWTARLRKCVVVSVLVWARPIPTRCLGQLALAGNAVVVSVWAGPGRFLPQLLGQLALAEMLLLYLFCAGPGHSYQLLDSSALAKMLLLYLFWAGPGRFLPAAWTARFGGNALVVSVLGRARPIPTRFVDSSPWRKCCCCICLGWAWPFYPLDSSPWRKCCCCICSGLGRADSYPLFGQLASAEMLLLSICSGLGRADFYPAWTARLGGNAVVVSVLGQAGPIPTAAWTARLGGNAVLYLFWVGQVRPIPAAWTARLGGNAVVPLFWAGPGRSYLGAVVSVLGWTGPIHGWTARLGEMVLYLFWAGPAVPARCLDSALAERLLLYLFGAGPGDSYPLLGWLPLAECCCLAYLFWVGPGRFLPAARTARLGGNAVIVSVWGWAGADSSRSGQLALAEMVVGSGLGRVIPTRRTARLGGNAVVVSVLGRADSPPFGQLALAKCCCCICSGLGRADSYPLLGQLALWKCCCCIFSGAGPADSYPLLGRLALAEMLLLYLFGVGQGQILPAVWTARLGKCCCCICSGLAGPIPTRCLDSSPWRKCCCCICSGPGQADSYPLLGQLALAEMLLLYLFWAGPGRFPTRCLDSSPWRKCCCCICSGLGGPIPTRCLDSSPWRKCCCCICFWAGPADSCPLLGQLALAEMLLYLFWAGPGHSCPLLGQLALAEMLFVVSVLGWAGPIPPPAAWTARLGGNTVVVSFLGRAGPIPTPLDSSPWEMLLLYLFWVGPGRFLLLSYSSVEILLLYLFWRADSYPLLGRKARLGGNTVVVSVLRWAGPIPTRRLDSSPWRKCWCCICSGLGRADSYRCLDSSPWRKCCCCICSAGQADSYPSLGQLALAEMLLLYLFWVGQADSNRCLDSSPWRKCCCCICSGSGQADSYPLLGQLRLGGNVVVSLSGSGQADSYPLLGQLALGGNAVVVSVLGWAGPILPADRTARLGGNAVVVVFCFLVGPGRLFWARADSLSWTARLGGCCCCIFSGLERADSYRCLDKMPWRKCCCCICSGLGRPIPTRCLDSSPWRKCVVVSVLGSGRADSYPLLGWAGPIPTTGQLALAEMLLLYLFWVGPGRFLPAAWTARLGGNVVVVSVLGRAIIPTRCLTARLGGKRCCCICSGLGPLIPTRCLDSSPWRKCCCCVFSGSGQADSPTRCFDSLPWRKCCCWLCLGIGPILPRCAGAGGTARLGGNAVVVSVLGWAGPIPTRCLDSSPWRKCCCIRSGWPGRFLTTTWTARLGGNAVVVSVLGQGQADSYPLLGQLALAEMLLLYLFWVGQADSYPLLGQLAYGNSYRCCCIFSGSGPGRFLPAAWTARLGGNAVVVSVLGWAGPILPAAWTARLGGMLLLYVLGWVADSYQLLGQLALAEMLLLYPFWAGPGRFLPAAGQLALAEMQLLYLFWVGPGRFLPAAWTARLAECCCCICSGLGRSIPTAAWTARLGGNAVVVSVWAGRADSTAALDSSPWRKCCCCICSGAGRADSLPAAWTARLGGNAVVVSVLGWAGPIPTRCWTARLGGNAVVVSVLGWAGPIPTRCLDSSPWRKGCCCICSGLGRADSLPAARTARLGGNAVVVSVLGRARPIPLPAAWTARLGGNAVVVSFLGLGQPILPAAWIARLGGNAVVSVMGSGPGRFLPRCLDSSPLAEMLLLYLFWAGPVPILPAAWTSRLGGNADVVSVLGRPGRFLPAARTARLGGNAVVICSGLGGHRCLDSSPWRKCCCCTVLLGLDSTSCFGGNAVVVSVLGRAGPIPLPLPRTARLGGNAVVQPSVLGRAGRFYPLLGQLALAEMLLLYLSGSGQPIPARCWTARLGGNAVVVSVLGWAVPDSLPAALDSWPWQKYCICSGLGRADSTRCLDARLGGNAVVVSVLGWAGDSYRGRLLICSGSGQANSTGLDSSPWRKCCYCLCSSPGRADSYPLLGQLAGGNCWTGRVRFLLGQLALAEICCCISGLGRGGSTTLADSSPWPFLLYLFWARLWTARLGGNAVVVSVLRWPGRFLSAAWTARLGRKCCCCICSGLGQASSHRCLDGSPWRKCCCCIRSALGRADAILLGQLALAEMLLLYLFWVRARPILTAAWTARLGGNAVVVSVLGQARPIPGTGTLALAEMLLLYLFWVGPIPYPLFGQLALAEMLLLYLFLGWAGADSYRCLDISPWRKCCCCICSGLGRADSCPLLGQLALAEMLLLYLFWAGPGRFPPAVWTARLGGNAVVSVLGWAGPIPTRCLDSSPWRNIVVSVLGWAGPIPTRCLDSSPWRKCCCLYLFWAGPLPISAFLDSSPWRKCCCCICSGWAGPIHYPLGWLMAEMLLFVSVLGRARPIPTRCLDSSLAEMLLLYLFWAGPADSYPLLGQLALAEMLLLYLCSGPGRADSYPLLGQLALAEMLMYLFWAGPGDSYPLLDSSPQPEMLLLYLFWAGPGRFLPAAWTARLAEMLLLISVLRRAGRFYRCWTARLGGNAVVVSVLGQAGPISYPLLGQLAAEMLLLYLFWARPCRSYPLLDGSPWRKCCCCICSGLGRADSYPLFGRSPWQKAVVVSVLGCARPILPLWTNLPWRKCCCCIFSGLGRAVLPAALDSSPWRKCCCCICSGLGRADSYPLLGRLALAEMLLLYLFWAGPGRFLPAAWTARLGGNAVVVLFWAGPGRFLPAAWTARLGGNAVVVSVLGPGQADSYRCLDLHSSPWRKCCCSRLGGNAVVVSVLGRARPIPNRCLDSSPWRNAVVVCSGLGQADSYPLLGQLALAEMLLLYLFWVGPGRFLPAAWTARLGGNAVVVSVLGRAGPIPYPLLGQLALAKCCCCICSGWRADSYPLLDSSPWRKCCCCICSAGWAGPIPTRCLDSSPWRNAVVVSVLGRAGPIPTRCLDSSPWRKCCCCVCSGSGQADSYHRAAWTARLGGNALVVSVLGQGRADSTAAWTARLGEMLLLYLFWAGPGRFLPLPDSSPWRKCCCCICSGLGQADSYRCPEILLTVLLLGGACCWRKLYLFWVGQADSYPAAWTARLGGNAVVVSVLGLAGPIPNRCLDSSPWRKCCCCICSGLGRFLPAAWTARLGGNAVVVSVLGRARPIPTRCLDSSPWRKCCCCICSGSGRADSYPASCWTCSFWVARLPPAAWTARLWRKLLLYLFWAGPGRFLPLLDNSPWRKCCCCICSGLGRADSYPLLGHLALAEMLLLYLFWAGRFPTGDSRCIVLGRPGLPTRCLDSSPWICCCICSGWARPIPPTRCWTARLGGNAVVSVSVLGCLDSSPWRKSLLSVLGWDRFFSPWTARLGGNTVVVSVLGWAGQDFYPLAQLWTARLGQADSVVSSPNLFWAGPGRFLTAAWTARLGEMLLLYLFWAGPGRFLPAAWTSRLGGNAVVVSVLGRWAWGQRLGGNPPCRLGQLALAEMLLLYLFWAGPGRFLPAAWTARLGGNAVVVSVLGWASYPLPGNAVVVSVLGWAVPIPTRCLDSSPWRKCCCCICSGLGQADSYPLFGQLAFGGNAVVVSVLGWAGPGEPSGNAVVVSVQLPLAEARLAVVVVVCSGLGRADSYPLLGQLALAEMLLLYLFWVGPGRFLPAAWTARLGGNAVVVSVLGWARPIPTRCLDSSPWRKCCCCICSGLGRAIPTRWRTARLGGPKCCCCICSGFWPGRFLPRFLDSSPWQKCCCCICSGSGQADSYPLLGQLALAEMLLLYLFWAGPGRFLTAAWTLALAEMLLLYLFWVGPGRFLPAGQLALAEMLLLCLFWVGPGRFLPAAWTARLGGNAVVICSGVGPGRFPTRCLDSSPWRKCCCICSGLGRADSYPLLGPARLGGNAVVVSVLGLGQADSYPLLGQLALAEMLLLYLFWAGPGRFLPLFGQLASAEMLLLYLFWVGPGPIPTRCLDSSPWRKCCCCICSAPGRADSYRCLDSSPWRKCCCCICSGLGQADSTAA